MHPDDSDPNGVRRGYEQAGIDALRAALDDNDTPDGEHLRLLRLADDGRLYRNQATGAWYARSPLGAFLEAAPAAEHLHTRGLIQPGAKVARTGWLRAEPTDAGRALAAHDTPPRHPEGTP